MKIEDIEEDLKKRIDQTRNWLADVESPVVDDLEARGTPCKATAIELINDTSRKEPDWTSPSTYDTYGL